MLFQQCWQSRVEIIELPQNVYNIQLHWNLVATINVGLRSFPTLNIAAEKLKDGFDEVEDVVTQMERSRGDLFVLPSLEEFVTKTYFIGFSVVLRHDEHDADDSANQASDIWEVFIHLVEFSLESGLGYGLL